MQNMDIKKIFRILSLLHFTDIILNKTCKNVKKVGNYNYSNILDLPEKSETYVTPLSHRKRRGCIKKKSKQKYMHEDVWIVLKLQHSTMFSLLGFLAK